VLSRMEIVVKKNSNKNIVTKSIKFLSNTGGDTSMRFALIIGAVSIVSALMVPLAIEGNSRLLSFDRQNVDTIVTGSIKKPKRYHIRKSILDTDR
jgi:hypothetical protein